MPLGTVLFWGSHEMLYLGQDNGKLYVISSLGGIGDIYGSSETSYQVKSVAINTLDIIRWNRVSWLTMLTCADIPYISASEAGPSLFDIAFYSDAITLPSTSYTYTGKEIKPAVSTSGLIEGTDYEVSYANNVKPSSSATVTVTGKGSYSGTTSKTFTIGKLAQTITAKSSVKKKLQASADTKKLAKKTTVNLRKLAKVSAKSPLKFQKASKAGGKKIIVNTRTGKVTLKKGLKNGTYKVKVKVAAAENAFYQAAPEKTIALKVVVKG